MLALNPSKNHNHDSNSRLEPTQGFNPCVGWKKTIKTNKNQSTVTPNQDQLGWVLTQPHIKSPPQNNVQLSIINYQLSIINSVTALRLRAFA